MRNMMASGAALVAVLAFVLTPLASLAAEAKDAKQVPAAVPSEKKMEKELAAQQLVTRNLAHKMMGEVNLAALALDSALPEDALDHVRKAEKITRQLLKDAPEVISDTQFKYGKLSYAMQGEKKRYYVPVIDDVFLLSDYHTTYHAFSKTDLDEIDAGVVEVTISVDLRKVEQALTDAEKSVIAKDYAVARVALGNVFTDSITDERVATDPVWAVHDNLALAQNLIREKHYESARLTLEHAKKRLEELEKGHAKSSANSEFGKMREEITQLQDELRKDEPSFTEKISDRFSRWMSKVGSWYGVGSVDTL